MATLNVSEFCVLSAFRPFLRLLNAFNRDHFCYKDCCSKLRSVFYVICATMMVLLIAVVIIFAFWYLIEINASMKSFFVSLPILFSTLQMGLTFIALLLTNSTITNTVNRLQELIVQRKCSDLYTFLIVRFLAKTVLARQVFAKNHQYLAISPDWECH